MRGSLGNHQRPDRTTVPEDFFTYAHHQQHLPHPGHRE